MSFRLTRIGAGSFVVLGSLGMSAAAQAAPKDCRESPDAQVWFAPQDPAAGDPLRILFVAESVKAGDIHLTAPGKASAPAPTVTRGGPPFSFAAEVPAATAGTYRVELRSGEHTITCRTISVAARAKARRSRTQPAAVWANTRAWDRATENFYSAWIEALFDAPPDASLSFPSLAPVLHDPKRNFLFGYLGLREDNPKNKAVPAAEPDCADLPYYLRAYFSWKMGLPFGMRDCDRGNAARPPRCQSYSDNSQPAEGKEPLVAFRKFLRLLSNKVHSGSGRTALTDEQTDHYPVKLARNNMRPGTIYADPFGHVLMIVKWQDQTDSTGGRLLAVDGQPDNSVGRKRFWEGTFLFANDVKSAGPGFKAFRPLVSSGSGPPAPLGNEALAKDPRFALLSTEQAEMNPDAFYARLASLINPKGLDATAVYDETLSAIVEQLETRVGSVDTGEKYMREHATPPVAMPEGAKIFETVGPWEDYATPSRDMRLIIAMNVLLGLPDRVVHHPELFVLGGRKPAEVRADLLRLHEKRVHERSFEYHRADGTPFRLTVADVLARKPAFEVGYNPNDCVEVRWGATPGTPEAAPCQRHAPEDQRVRMNEYRSWFRDARRPSR